MSFGKDDGQHMPAWLAQSIAPTMAEQRQAAAEATAAQVSDAAKKRLRAPVATDPARQRLHELIVAQLHDEGFTEAASAVMRSTSCFAPSFDRKIDGGGAAQRLARLVSLGTVAERASLMHTTRQLRRTGVERALFSASVYASAASPSMYEFGEVFSSLPLDRPLRCVAFSPDGKYIAAGNTNGAVRLFSTSLMAERARALGGVQTAAPTHSCQVRHFGELHSQGVEWVGFHPTEPVVLSCGRDGRVVATDYSEPQGRPARHLMVWKASTSAANAASNADAGYTDTYPIRAASLHPGGDIIALATDHSTLRLLHLTTGQLFMPQEAHVGGISDVSFAADGRVLASASYDATWRVIDARTGSTAVNPASAPHCNVAVTSCQLSRSGHVLLTTGSDSQTKLWDLRKSATEIVAFGKVEKSSCILRSRFTFDEAAVVVDGAGRASTDVIDVFSATVVATIRHSQTQRGFAASPLSQTIATGGDDYRLRLFAPACVTEFLPDDVAEKLMGLPK